MLTGYKSPLTTYGDKERKTGVFEKITPNQLAAGLLVLCYARSYSTPDTYQAFLKKFKVEQGKIQELIADCDGDLDACVQKCSHTAQVQTKLYVNGRFLNTFENAMQNNFCSFNGILEFNRACFCKTKGCAENRVKPIQLSVGSDQSGPEALSHDGAMTAMAATQPLETHHVADTSCNFSLLQYLSRGTPEITNLPPAASFVTDDIVSQSLHLAWNNIELPSPCPTAHADDHQIQDDFDTQLTIDTNSLQQYSTVCSFHTLVTPEINIPQVGLENDVSMAASDGCGGDSESDVPDGYFL